MICKIIPRTTNTKTGETVASSLFVSIDHLIGNSNYNYNSNVRKGKFLDITSQQDDIKAIYNTLRSTEYQSIYSDNGFKLIDGEPYLGDVIRSLSNYSIQAKFPNFVKDMKFLVEQATNLPSLLLLDTLSKRLGIEYDIEATDSNEISYYKNGKVTFNARVFSKDFNKAKADEIALHEFTHPIIDHIELKDKSLFKRLLEEAKTTLTKREINKITKLYQTTNEAGKVTTDQSTLNKEIIVRAIDKERGLQSPKTSLFSKLKTWLFDLIKSIGNPLPNNGIESINTLNDINELLLNSSINVKLISQDLQKQYYREASDADLISSDPVVGTVDLINRLFSDTDSGLQKSLDAVNRFDPLAVNNDSTRLTVEYAKRSTTRGKLIVRFPGAKSNVQEFPFNSIAELQSITNTQKIEITNQLTTYSNDYSKRLSNILNLGLPNNTDEEEATEYQKALNELNENYDYEFMSKLKKSIDGKVKSNFMPYSTFVQLYPELAIADLADSNIVVEISRVKDTNGKSINRYTILVPSIGSGSDINQHTPFATKFFKTEGLTPSSNNAVIKGFTIGDTLEGSKHLLGSIIAMKIAQNDPTAEFDSLKYFNAYKVTSVKELGLEEGVNNIKLLNDQFPEFINGIISQDDDLVHTKALSEVLSKANDTAYADRFKQSYIQLLFSMDALDMLATGFTSGYFQAYDGKDLGDRTVRNGLLDAINRRKKTLYRVYGGSIDPVTGDSKLLNPLSKEGKEYLILSLAAYELEGRRFGQDLMELNRDMSLDNGIEVWIKGQGDHFNAYYNSLFGKVRSIMSRVKEKFIKYNTKKNKYFLDYLKQVKEYNGSKNIAFDYKEDLYKNLYQMVDLQVMEEYKEDGLVLTRKRLKLDSNGQPVIKSVHTSKLKEPNDPSLQSFEKELILDIVEGVRESVKALIKEKYNNRELNEKYRSMTFEEAFLAWEADNMNVVYNSDSTKMRYGNYLMMPALKKDFTTSILEGKVKDGFKAYMDAEFNMNSINLDTDTELYNNNSLGILDMFTQRGNDETGELALFGNRMGALGLVKEGDTVYLLDEKRNKRIASDLQTSLDFYQFKLMKELEDRNLKTTFLSAKSALIYDQLRSKKNKAVELELMEDLFKLLIFDEVKSIGVGRKNIDAAKALGMITSGVSKAVLSFNIASAIVAGLGANIALATSVLSRKYGKRFLGIKDWGNAIKFVNNPKNWQLVDDIMTAMQFHSTDEKSLIFNQNVKAGSNKYGILKGVAVGRNSMLTQGLGDYYAKALLLIGQMQFDGIIDNWKYDKNGELYYDWDQERANQSKVSTFRKNDREVTKDELVDANRLLNTKGDPLVPYGDTMKDSLTSIAGQLFGQVSDEQKGKLDTNVLVKALAQMKTYIAARANNLYSRGFYNPNISWYEQDANGNMIKVNHFQEGAFNTVVSTISQIRELGLKSGVEGLKPEQQATLRRLAIELALFALAMLVYGNIDDEDKKKNPYDYYVQAAIMDIVGVYNPVDYLNAITTPISIVYAMRLANATSDMVQFEFDSALKLTGATKTFTTVTSLFEDDTKFR